MTSPGNLATRLCAWSMTSLWSQRNNYMLCMVVFKGKKNHFLRKIDENILEIWKNIQLYQESFFNIKKF